MRIVGLVFAALVAAGSAAIAFVDVYLGCLFYALVCYASALMFALFIILIKPSFSALDPRKLVLGANRIAIYKRYYVYFRFPLISRVGADGLNSLRLVGAVWLLIALLSGHYILSALQAVFYAVASWPIAMMHPLLYWARSRQQEAEEQVRLIEDVSAAQKDFN